MSTIAKNQVKCKYCGAIIESVDGPVTCGCGKVTIAGGTQSLVRGNLSEGVDYEELAQYVLLG